MFTGIVEEAGRVLGVEPQGDVVRLRIGAGAVLAGLTAGSSIAVDGCCLTAIATAPGEFACELHRETLLRTAFQDRLRPGVRVNLERPMKADGRFDGHIVQGHVDGVGRILELLDLGRSAEMRVEPPRELLRFVAEKGSIAVDGISLTVASLGEGSFTVALIPYTLEVTNLRDARAGDLVNLEVDVIARYLERQLAASR